MRAWRSEDWIQIGDWRLTPAANLLVSPRREVRLEPRQADLLVFLAEHRDEVVSPDEILAAVWGGAVVGDHSVYQAVAKLRRALGDDAAESRYIETIPKRGYRLIAEVGRPPAAAPPVRPAAHPAPTVEARAARGGLMTRRPLAVWGALALVLLIPLVLMLRQLGPGPEASSVESRKSLVVLPFTSLSPDAVDALLAEGFAIELATLLGGADDFLVLGPVSAKLAASRGLQPIEMAEQLDADIVVSGSLRRSADQLRISATLTDAHSGVQLWSRIFDRSDGDVFQVQRSVATEIARALSERLGPDRARLLDSGLPADKGAYDDFLLGRYYRSIRSAASLERSRDLLERALERAPGFVPARRELAITYLLLSFYGDLPLRKALERAEPLLQQCLDADPDDAELQGAIGLSHYLQGAFGLAEEYLRRALGMAPSYVEGWMWLGLSEQQQGSLLDALDAFEHARGLEPLMVTAAINNANALSWSGDPREGRDLLETLSERVRDHPQLYLTLSGLALEAGDLPAAHAWARAALRIDPSDLLLRANMAMVLAYLGQEDAALPLVADARTLLEHGRGVQLYLGRMALTAPALIPPNIHALYDARLKDASSIPEIEWRLANARIGLVDYFSGDLEAARRRLDRSLAGRLYPIDRADYDLFICTSLVDLQQRLDDRRGTSRWLARCEEYLAEAKRQGWRSLALAYSEARLAQLQGRSSDALSQLKAAFGRGFRNRTLLRMDPVLAPLRGRPAFQALLAAMDKRLEAAWSQVLAQCGGADGSACVPTARPPGVESDPVSDLDQDRGSSGVSGSAAT